MSRVEALQDVLRTSPIHHSVQCKRAIEIQREELVHLIGLF